MIYKNAETKKESQFSDSYSLVKCPIEISNKFIDDFKKIIDFINYLCENIIFQRMNLLYETKIIHLLFIFLWFYNFL